MRHRRLFRNVSASALATVVYLATRFFIPPFVLAHVGIEAYGLYGTAFILVSYIGVSAIGFSNAYVKYTAQYFASGEMARANRLLSAGLTLSSAVSLAGFAGVVQLWPAISHWMRVPAALADDARFLVFTVTGTFFVYLTMSVYRDALTGLQEIAITQKVWVASFLLESVLSLGLVGCGFGLRGLAIAFLLRTSVEVFGNAWLVNRYFRTLRIRLTWPDRESLKLLGSFGGICQVNCLLATFLGSAERMIATPLLGLSAAGLLDLGARFPNMATALPSAFFSAVLPSASAISADRNEETTTGLYFATSRYMNTLSGVLFAFLTFAAAPCLVFWLKTVPQGAVLVMVVFAIAAQIHMLTGPGTSILKANAKPWMEFHYSGANLITLALFVPASRLLLGRWEVAGIASAVALSTAVSACWFVSRAHRSLDIKAGRYLREVLLPGVLPWLAAAFCIAPFARWAASGDRIRAAIALTPLGLSYLAVSAVLLVFFAGTTEEKGALSEFLSRLRARFGSPSPVNHANEIGLKTTV